MKRDDGETARFNAALADFPHLAEIVQRRTFPPLWAAAKQKLADGEPAEFGENISITPEAITSGKQVVKWAEAKPMALKGQHYIVKRQGSWSAILRHHSAIVDYHVLLALTAELQKPE